MTQRAYVPNFDSNSVTVIDVTRDAAVAAVPVGKSPMAFGAFIGPAPPP